MTSQRTRAAANAASADGANIFWTALRLIGRGFVEIAQGIGLIAEGTLRPVRSFVPSFVALASIAALTTVTLVGIITTVAHADLQASPAPGVTWARWSTSPEIRFGDNTLRETDLAHLTETDTETTYVALWPSDR